MSSGPHGPIFEDRNIQIQQFSSAKLCRTKRFAARTKILRHLFRVPTAPGKPGKW